MLGSVNNYGRQIIISTGVSDWPRDVTDDGSSLATLVSKVYGSSGEKGASLVDKLSNKLKRTVFSGTEGENEGAPGIFPSSATSGGFDKLSILNASTIPSSHQDGMQSVIVLPDYKVVERVPETTAGATELVVRHPCLM